MADLIARFANEVRRLWSATGQLLQQYRDQANFSKSSAVGLLIAVFACVLDQISKFWVLDVLEFSPPGCLERQLGRATESAYAACGRIEVSGVFDLTMVWNKGVSFGLLGADNDVGRWMLVAFSVLITVLLIFGLLNTGPMRADRPLLFVAFGLVAGGAVGNVIDRVIYGAVVDFLDFSDIGFIWVFNLADTWVNVGVGLIILDLLLQGRKDPSTS